ncbi:MAG: hypothetical protein ACI4QR_01740 [Eubacteriales bacterium]
MTWFNPYGLAFMAVIMIPNIIFALKHKECFENRGVSKTLEIFEQLGRYGCFATMIFNVPFISFGFASNEAFAVYLILDTVLVFAYCFIWAACLGKNSIFRALSLSVVPSAVFLFSGIMSRSVLLIIFSVIFAPCHIIISLKNAS